MVVVALICSSNLAAAHHDIGQAYRVKDLTNIEGKVVRTVFRNPHSYVLLRETGHEEMVWSLEWASAKRLRQQGVQPSTIRVGDYLVVTGYPPRKADERRILIHSLTRRSDGFNWGSRKGETVEGFSILGPLSQ
jgi:hypothetical protein